MKELKTLQDLVQNARERGNKECLVQFGDDTTHRFSYAELHDRVLRLAGGLSARGIGPGKVVALVAENRYQTVFIALAVIHCGAAIMPIDPQFDKENLAHVLNDASPALLFAPQGQAERVDKLDIEPKPDILYTDRREEQEGSWLSIVAEPGDLPEIDGSDVATLFYTSGTTGKPKGVPLSHANLVFQQNALINSGLVGEGDRLLLPLPLHHVYPFVVGMLAPLTLGLTLILPRALTGTEVARAIHDGEATLIVGVPRLYEALVSGIESRIESAGYIARMIGGLSLRLCMFCRRNLHLRLGKMLLGKLHRQFGKQLEVLASGGAPLDPELAWRLEGLGWKVAIGYGLTETSPILTINPPGSGRMQSVGRPLEGVRIRIDETAHPQGETARGMEEGEIQAKGTGVFAGYRHLEEKNRDSFTRDGWFKTGDLGHMEEGWLRVTGRASTMIVTRGGENVQPDEVEHAIEAHRHIKEAGILDRDGEILVLVVPHPGTIRAEGAEVEAAAHRAVSEAVGKLPSYMQPTEVVVSHRPIERTRLGKIKRHKLKEHYRSVQESEDGEGLEPMPPERMDAEDRKLLKAPAASTAWDLLAERFPRRGLSPDANLRSDLGVDSMGWLNLSMELRGRTGIDLSEEAIAGIESVRDLLKEVKEGKGKAGEEHANPVEHPEKYLDKESERWLTELSSGQRVAAHLARWFVRLFSLVWFRAETEGAGNIPTDKQLVFTPNHVSFLDPLVLAALIPYNLLRRTQFAGLSDPAFANSFTTFFARLAFAFPVDPVRRPGTGLAYGSEVLRRNRSLIWFPEGARSRTGSLGAFLPGLGLILAKHPCLVVPVYIAGTRAAMPPGSLLIRPKKVVVYFGEPISSEKLEKEGKGEEPQERIMDALKQRVAELCERAGEKI